LQFILSLNKRNRLPQRIDNGEWVEGFLMCNYDPHQKDNVIIEAYIYPGLRNITHPVEVDPDTVGQFTGLLNDQGIELFEGDRYKWPNGKGGEIGVIIFEDGMFCCKTETKVYALNSMNIYCEVIGTVHD